VDLAAQLHEATEVEVVGAHRLRIAFDDGVSQKIDGRLGTMTLPTGAVAEGRGRLSA
jgi:hypothetical protein